jgi:uncharacterized damage-inducible protein DinB
MPGLVPPVPDERSGLLGFLAQARYHLRLTAHGLTDAQAAAAPTASTLTIGGLLRHAAVTERAWVDRVLQRERQTAEEKAATYGDSFRFGAGDSLAEVLALYDEVAAETEKELAGLPLDHPVPVPRDAPWFPADIDHWSVRWVLLHLIQETSRHAGHADLIREEIDGATAFPLMAAAEGWPATSWLRPWQPPTAAT